MKVLLIIAVLSMAAFALELKGFELGAKYTGAEEVNTTLGGIEGAIIASSLKDTRLWSIGFIPNGRIHEADLNSLIIGVENKYKVKLSEHKGGKYTKGVYYTAYSDDDKYMFFINTEHFYDGSYKIVLLVRDIALAEISAKEEQEKSNNDF